MGKAVYEADRIPVISGSEPVLNRPVKIGGEDCRITCVSVGNPHYVVFTDSIDPLDLEEIGPKFEFSEMFPERVNTEFVRVIDRTTLRIRVWERGNGETLACGTGACAAAAAAVQKDRTADCLKNDPLDSLTYGSVRGCLIPPYSIYFRIFTSLLLWI